MHVVSVRLIDEQYQTVVENCRLSGRKLSDFRRRGLLNTAKKANEAGFKLVKWSIDLLGKDMKSLGGITKGSDFAGCARYVLALEYMEKMGIKNTQFIIARHPDSSTKSLCNAKNVHPHCHIVYNRVDNNGECVSDNFEYFRNNTICDEQKKSMV